MTDHHRFVRSGVRAVSRLALVPLLALAAMLAVLAPAQAAVVAPQAAAGSLTVSVAEPLPLTYGQTATVQGVLTDPAGAPVGGASVVAEAPGPDGAWVVVAGPAATDAAGAVSLTVSPTVSMAVRLRHDAAEGAASEPLTVGVRALLTAVLDRNAAPVGRDVTMAGLLAPAREGAFVRVERRVDGRWLRVAKVPVAADGAWQVRVRPEAPRSQRYRAVRPASGGLLEAIAGAGLLEGYRLHRYSVVTRGRVSTDLARFRTIVDETLNDPRGWSRSHRRFREVARGGDFTVVLAEASTLPSYSGECSTTYSCRVGRFVIVNDLRWRRGSPYFPGDLETYRRMVVNHETGHWLGRGHAYCGGRGRPAPVMQQQSKGLQGCRVNAWPLPWEIRAL